MSREKFEKWFETRYPNIQKTIDEHGYHESAVFKENMWECWQEQQKVIDKLESQLRGHKIALDIFSQNERCKHFSTTMFHDGKAECFQCNAIVNEKREVVGQQSKGLFNKESEP